VVHVSWDDASAYCKWAGKRQPTEAEWEWAARGGLIEKKYPWGNEDPEQGKTKTNIWQGDFPNKNLATDGFVNAAPVASFSPNGYNLFDMAGNVWEWCNDSYSDPMEPSVPQKIMKGGSFLCNASYCKGYRVSAKMKTSADTGLEHTGFRTVKDR
jgi:formylglycine-generating enzyme required for sulfatase activity